LEENWRRTKGRGRFAGWLEGGIVFLQGAGIGAEPKMERKKPGREKWGSFFWEDPQKTRSGARSLVCN